MRDHAVFDPEIETRSTSEQFELDRKRYLAQIQYLFSHSAFYRAKLTEAGFDTPEKVGDLSDIGALPFTEKDEIRETQANHGPFGAHLAADPSDLRRVFSTSGTTGIPCYLGLTESDLKSLVTRAHAHFPGHIFPCLGRPSTVTFLFHASVNSTDAGIRLPDSRVLRHPVKSPSIARVSATASLSSRLTSPFRNAPVTAVFASAHRSSHSLAKNRLARCSAKPLQVKNWKSGGFVLARSGWGIAL